MKGYKWLLSQNQRVRVDFLAYRRWKAPAKYIKPFSKKTLNSNDVNAWTIHLILVKLQAYSLQTANLLQIDFTIDFLWKQPVLNSLFWEKKSLMYQRLNRFEVLQCAAWNFMELAVDLISMIFLKKRSKFCCVFKKTSLVEASIE